MNSLTKIFLFLFSPCTFCFAENDSVFQWTLSANGHFGAIISHHDDMEFLVKGHLSGGELSLSRHTSGKKDWQRIYRHPEMGVSFFYVDLANPELLGKAYALYPFLQTPLISKKNFKLSFRAGVGLGYETKVWDRVENHKNTAMSTNFNGYVNLRLNTLTTISERFRLEAGFGLSHLSNGALAKPNLGINFPTINFGLGIGSGKKINIIKRDSLSVLHKKVVEYSATFALGFSEVSASDEKKYPAFTLSFNAKKYFHPKAKFGGGIEFFYNNANQPYLNVDSAYISKNAANFLFGGKISYDFVIAKLSVPVEMGVYAYNKMYNNGPIYHRIGLRYEITKHLIANLSLKTHWAKADYFEWGLGYKF